MNGSAGLLTVAGNDLYRDDFVAGEQPKRAASPTIYSVREELSRVSGLVNCNQRRRVGPTQQEATLRKLNLVSTIFTRKWQLAHFGDSSTCTYITSNRL